MKARIKRSQVAGMNLMYKWYSFEYFLNAMEELGFESISIWGGPPHIPCDYLSYTDCLALRKQIKRHHLNPLTYLLTGSAYRNQMATEEKEYAEKSFQYFRNGIVMCEELGVSCMTCNSGWGYLSKGREEAWKRSKDMLVRLADEAQKHGVILAMESLKSVETNLVVTLEDAKRMYQEINHPSFKIVADTGAISFNGETLWEWFTQFGKEIRSMHFVDSMHTVWGDGNLALDDMVMALAVNHYNQAISLEMSDSRYYSNPKEADRRNMVALSRFF